MSATDGLVRVLRDLAQEVASALDAAEQGDLHGCDLELRAAAVSLREARDWGARTRLDGDGEED